MLSVHASSADSSLPRLTRFIPEPKNRTGFNFRKVAQQMESLLTGGTLGSVTGIDPGFQEILNKQLELQQQMLLVSLNSNIERTRHETGMAAVRNMRVA